MRLTNKNGIRKIAVYKVYETLKESEERYKEKQLSCEIYNKLADLEDIEEELKIDLITLFKVLKQDNIWVREHNTNEQEIVYERVRLNFLKRTLDFVEPRKEIGRGRNLSDCGITWALTKEELL